MVNYENGKIYKIVCNKSGKIYVGSTTLLLCQRLVMHRKAYNKYVKTNKSYITAFDIMKNGDYNIILLEACPCKNREELLKKEREYFDLLPCVNSDRPYITEEEKLISDKICKRNYQLNNKEKLYAKEREKRQTPESKQKRREYDLKNIEHKKAYDKLYREKKKLEKLKNISNINE